MPYARTIAIDGPAGSGKSTIGRRLAAALDYAFLDSGVLYRAITRRAVTKKVNLSDADALAEFANELSIEVTSVSSRLRFRIDGKRVRKLQAPVIESRVPLVAACSTVRDKVRQVQRAFAAQGHVIIAGRDIGTVVLPDAELKIFLDVSLEERAARRYRGQSGPPGNKEDIMTELLLRDVADSTREASPMLVAEDARVVSTDGMTIDAVLALLLELAQQNPTAPDFSA